MVQLHLQQEVILLIIWNKCLIVVSFGHLVASRKLDVIWWSLLMSIRMHIPLLKIDNVLDSWSHACRSSTLDLYSGYWQMEVDPKDCPETAFTTQEWLFEVTDQSFGVCNTPSTFRRLNEWLALDYLFDIFRLYHCLWANISGITASSGWSVCKTSPTWKCIPLNVICSSLRITIEGMLSMLRELLHTAGRKWPVQRNQTDVQSFVGLASY